MLLLINGKIYCGFDFAEAIVFDNESIIEIGKSSDLLLKYPDAKIIDLEKKLVLPGFNDSHMHLIGYALSKKTLSLYNIKSISEVIRLGKIYAKDKEIIIAKGYNCELFEESRGLTKDDLDQISTDIPIIAYRVCGHVASVNSCALKLANITIDTRVDGGMIDVDSNNNLTGVFRENAIKLLNSLFNQMSIDELSEMIVDAVKDLNKNGITSIGTNDIMDDLTHANNVYQAYNNLNLVNNLNVRVNHQITFSDGEFIASFLENKKDSKFLKIGALKLFIDGSLGGKTAYMSDNYLNEDHQGILCIEPHDLDKIINYANSIDLQVLIHAIGDLGIKVCLDGFEKVINKENKLRHGIIHVQITDLEILKRFQDLQVMALVQPLFINSDMNIVYSRISQELANTSYAFKTLLNTTKTSFSSDAPVEDFNPMLGIYSSCTRANLANDKTYNLDQKTTVSEAILAYTINSAYMTFEENLKGMIKVGYYPDLVVLSEDIFEIPNTQIKDVDVQMTIVGGRIVYEKR